MQTILVVVRPFGSYAIGDVITSPDVIAKALADHPTHVVKINPARRRPDPMPIVQQGTINTTALIVPDLYVQIVPPQNLVLNGVPTNVLGVVGSANWDRSTSPLSWPRWPITPAFSARSCRRKSTWALKLRPPSSKAPAISAAFGSPTGRIQQPSYQLSCYTAGDLSNRSLPRASYGLTG